jgi:hypothetical protein
LLLAALRSIRRAISPIRTRCLSIAAANSSGVVPIARCPAPSRRERVFRDRLHVAGNPVAQGRGHVAPAEKARKGIDRHLWIAGLGRRGHIGQHRCTLRIEHGNDASLADCTGALVASTDVTRICIRPSPRSTCGVAMSR